MTDPFKYEPEKLEPWQRWQGEGKPPRRWWAVNPETKEKEMIYRSYADFVDD